MTRTFSLNSISEVHEAIGLPKPKHPLVTVIQVNQIKSKEQFKDVKVIPNLYQIALKIGHCGVLKYGRNSYDYQDGTLVFMAPGQVMEYEPGEDDEHQGWTLGFHPDLIRKSDLAQKMNQYTFFSYDVNEALHVSDEERRTIEEILDKIVREYSQNLDRHSQHLIISNIELLLDYCMRFYDRQFYTRTNLNSDILSKFERLLHSYYEENLNEEMGLPSVHYCADELNFSSNYLSDLLKKETGKSAQEHIHLFVIDRAKNSLLNSSNSISQIGYALGFEYPQHFSNLFKSKTGLSPREFRSLN